MRARHRAALYAGPAVIGAFSGVCVKPLISREQCRTTPVGCTDRAIRVAQRPTAGEGRHGVKGHIVVLRHDRLRASCCTVSRPPQPAPPKHPVPANMLGGLGRHPPRCGPLAALCRRVPARQMARFVAQAFERSCTPAPWLERPLAHTGLLETAIALMNARA